MAGQRVDRSRAQAELARDRRRGRGVIAGDHLDVDPRRLAFGDRLNRFRPRRIDEPDEADEREAARIDIVEFEASRAARSLRGECDDRWPRPASLSISPRHACAASNSSPVAERCEPQSSSTRSGAPLTVMTSSAPTRLRVAMKR